MMTLRYFRNAQEARTYRHQYGTGGWIFEPEDGSDSILFPPHMCPTEIFHHKVTRGMGGNLIGNS